MRAAGLGARARDIGRRARKAPKPSPLLFAGCMLGGLWALVAAGLYYAYHDALSEAADHTQILARVVDEHFQRTLETVDRALLAIAVDLRSDPGRWQRNDPGTRADMKQFIRSLPHVEAMTLFGPDGNPVNSTRALPVSYNASDKDFYDGHLSPVHPQQILSTPQVSPITGDRILVISRRIDDRAGGFRGVLAAGLRVDYLIDFYGAIDRGDFCLGLADATGIILARHPDALIGKHLTPLDPFREATASTPATLRGIGPAGQREIILSARRVGTLGFYSYAGTPVGRVLAPVWQRGFVVVTVAVIFSLVTLRIAWQLHLHRKRLRTAVDKVSRANAELERVAVVASHDLREPLRSVVGFSQILSRRYDAVLEPEAREMLGHLTRSAKRMDALITDLLTYTGVTMTGGSMQPVDSGRVFALAVEALGSLLDKAGAKVVRNTPLPVVWADEMQLFQVFCNLLRNALTFRRAGAAPRIEVSAEPHDGMWCLAVADNGIGISDEDRETVFLLYKRLGPRDSEPGTGAGLAICKRIVERHGGRMWVHGTPGAGSTFYFTLPSASDPPAVTPTSASPTGRAEYAS